MADSAFRKEKEYYALFDIINKYDDRFITIKSWGVTLSMAALGAGFQFGHYGLFLIACISSFAFWLIEGTMKRHQKRYYIRMREIETAEETATYRPKIDLSWAEAGKHYKGRLVYAASWFLPAVMLPYIVSFLAGAILFFMGLGSLLKLADGKLMPM